jgi:hypothetical protein
MEKKSEEILDLLKSKNRCLDRLMAATKIFLAAPLEAIVSEESAERNPLDIYENARTTIIQALELHDNTIQKMIATLSKEDRTPELIDAVRNEVLKNERLIVSVFNADDVVFKKIGSAQNQISKLIQENRKSNEILSRFKSAQVQTGEEMDQTV